MHRSTREELRRIAEWEPPLGVLSVYLDFEPDDRGGAWRTRLRNGLDRVLAEAEGAEHELRMAVRATAERLAERYEDDELRPPPRAEAGFLEVSANGGGERWWPAGVPAPEDRVVLSPRASLAPLVEIAERDAPRGVVLVSAERVRLLRHAAGGLAELDEWELSVTSLDWRERKSASATDPSRGQGVSASGHDQYRERLRHNRERFLREAAGLVERRRRADGLEDLLVFAPAAEREPFLSGLGGNGHAGERVGDADLVSSPAPVVREHVDAAVGRLLEARQAAAVSRALGDDDGGRPGARGPAEALQALAEGRVECLVLGPAAGDLAETLVRGALAGGAEIAIVRGEPAERLREADGVAASLRY